TLRLGRGRAWVPSTPLSAQDVRDDPELQLLKGIALAHQAGVYQLLGEREQWLRTTQLSANVFRRLVQQHPQKAVYKRELSLTLQGLATKFYQEGRAQEARDLFRESVALLRDAIDVDPNDVESRYMLAVTLVWLDPTLRDPKAAVEHARHAVQ